MGEGQRTRGEEGGSATGGWVEERPSADGLFHLLSALSTFSLLYDNLLFMGFFYSSSNLLKVSNRGEHSIVFFWKGFLKYHLFIK